MFGNLCIFFGDFCVVSFFAPSSAFCISWSHSPPAIDPGSGQFVFGSVNNTHLIPLLPRLPALSCISLISSAPVSNRPEGYSRFVCLLLFCLPAWEMEPPDWKASIWKIYLSIVGGIGSLSDYTDGDGPCWKSVRKQRKQILPNQKSDIKKTEIRHNKSEIRK